MSVIHKFTPGQFHMQIAAHPVIWKQMTDTLETQSEGDEIEI